MVTSDEHGDDGDLTFTLDDSCAHCSEPIRLEARGGELATMEPDTVWVQQGGGWAVDNLFWSEEHLNEWLNDYPAYKRLRQMPVREFLQALERGEVR